MLLPVAKLCAAWSLLAALSFNLCVGVSGTPLRALDRLDAHKCLSYSRALLTSVTSALAPNDFGFYCTEMNMEMNRRNMTVCEPNHDQDARCGSNPARRFNQNACLSAIRDDLQYYRDVLSTFKNGNLTAIIQQAIPELMEATTAPALDLTTATFYQRVHLCKILRGFHTRTITINRVMSYIAAGDHK
ncbi:hypothetical protein Z043_114384 [Scleropages formosus]|uniref:Interleukin-12 subunit alpha n=1 Tax=Scleropages formosus TaxID=113540 RepID=A0A0P7V3E1_SCLFO|nr:hypothetical protein Z043_114384 [Scleropages formosus]